MKMGEKATMAIEAVSTGALALDLALGIGGLPRGRITEIYGPESSGKTTLAMHVVAEAQRNGGICAYIDAEHAMDPAYARAIGLDVDELLISQPDTGEQALEIADMLVRSGAIDVIVIDSVAALTPRAEIEGEMGDSHVGLQARLMSQALRKLTANLNKTKTICIFINQLREKIGVLFGSPETTPGGRALKFYSSVRIDIRRIEAIKDGVEVVGNRTRCKVVKNKCFAAGTTVFDPVTGLTHRIEDVVERGEAGHVVAADKLGCLHVRPITQRFDQGEAQVVGLRLRDGTVLRVTPDHEVMTETGWRPAGEIVAGDRVARPRRLLGFGDVEPMSPARARLLGQRIACGADGGKIPAGFFAPDHSAEVLANLLFGIWVDAGYVTREPTGGVRVGFTTTSEQLAHQIHWLLLRWGIGSSVRPQDPAPPTAQRPVWETRLAAVEDIARFSEIMPNLDHKAEVLAAEAASLAPVARAGSPRNRLPAVQTAPVLAYLRGRGVTAELATLLVGEQAGLVGEQAGLVGEQTGDPRGDLEQVLGTPRLRRDRLQSLADGLDSPFLREVLAEEVFYDEVTEVLAPEWRRIYDIEVAEHHTLVADDVVASNCAPPFRQAEFDIMYGKGISREGSLLDIGVDLGLVKKSGAWYTYEGEQLGQGRENAKVFLAEHPEVMVEISERIRAQMGIGKGAEDGESVDGDDLGIDLDAPISLED
jgi:protein RecA